jgi:predicted nuclease of predicted toxin-antitoxin system
VRLLVDEDQASKTLLSALGEISSLEVLPPVRATSDDEVWQHAQRERAAILTGNAKDFVPRAREVPGHAGLLLVTRQNRPGDLTATQIASGVRAIVETYPDGVEGMTLAVNPFVRSAQG